MVAAIEVARSGREPTRSESAESIVDRAVREPQHPFVQLAKQTVERYVRSDPSRGRRSWRLSSSWRFEGQPPSGVFVSIKKWGDLRGCIGTIEATQMNVGMEIVHNADRRLQSRPALPARHARRSWRT